MRKRLYCVLPDLASAHAALEDLLQAGVDLRHMHFVAREDCDLSGLHPANVLQTSDLIGSAEAGLVAGAAVGGVLGAVAAVSYPAAGEPVQWGWIPGLVGAGALVEAWTSSMIGISAPSRRLKPFAAQIAQGRILLLVDVPPRQLRQIAGRLQALHGEATADGSLQLG